MVLGIISIYKKQGKRSMGLLSEGRNVRQDGSNQRYPQHGTHSTTQERRKKQSCSYWQRHVALSFPWKQSMPTRKIVDDSSLPVTDKRSVVTVFGNLPLGEFSFPSATTTSIT